MATYEVVSIIDGQPTFEKPLSDILSDLKAGAADEPEVSAGQ